VHHPEEPGSNQCSDHARAHGQLMWEPFPSREKGNTPLTQRKLTSRLKTRAGGTKKPRTNSWRPVALNNQPSPGKQGTLPSPTAPLSGKRTNIDEHVRQGRTHITRGGPNQGGTKAGPASKPSHLKNKPDQAGVCTRSLAIQRKPIPDPYDECGDVSKH